MSEKRLKTLMRQFSAQDVVSWRRKDENGVWPSIVRDDPGNVERMVLEIYRSSPSNRPRHIEVVDQDILHGSAHGPSVF